VAELSLGAQTKLLRVLQEKRFERLGGTQTLESDARVIAATNVDLKEAIAARRFREDLYYRLHVLPVQMPSLAERFDDVVTLARSFVVHSTKRHRLNETRLSPITETILLGRRWPGNVRELEHALEAAVIRAAGEGSSIILPHHVFPEAGPVTAEESSGGSFQDATRRFQRDLLQRTLAESNGNVSETGRRLGITRAHVYNLLTSLGIERTTPAST
jgi:Nif-specific regulatory protein